MGYSGYVTEIIRGLESKDKELKWYHDPIVEGILNENEIKDPLKAYNILYRLSVRSDEDKGKHNGRTLNSKLVGSALGITGRKAGIILDALEEAHYVEHNNRKDDQSDKGKSQQNGHTGRRMKYLVLQEMWKKSRTAKENALVPA